MALFMPIVLVFMIPALALKGFVLYSGLFAFAYTIYTSSIYTSYDWIVMN